jgi:hypothetical protein
VKYRNLIAAVFIVMALPLANALGQEGASPHAKVSGIDKSLFSDTVSAGENEKMFIINSFFRPESPRRVSFYGNNTNFPVNLKVIYTDL